jgi:hypothetical protein
MHDAGKARIQPLAVKRLKCFQTAGLFCIAVCDGLTGAVVAPDGMPVLTPYVM